MAIVIKDRCACKTEHLRIVEELFDIAMGFTKLTAMTFIEDKHDFFIPKIVDVFAIFIGADGTIQLLQCGDDELVMLLIELIDQCFGIGGAIHAIGFEVVKLFGGLCIEIIAIDHE